MLRKLHEYLSRVLSSYEARDFSGDHIVVSGDSPEGRITLCELRQMVCELEAIVKPKPDVEYLVRQVKICPECHGDRVIQHPDWAAFWEEYKLGIPSAEQQMAFWAERGYDIPPNEEGPCHECDGTGKIVTWVSLADAIAGLGGNLEK